MDVRNCITCGKIFNYIGVTALCPSCSKKLDEKFGQVKAYLYDHPGAGIQEVSEENDVTPTQIRKWIREERLAFADNSAVGIECENCGTMIRTGRFCQACKDKLANNLSNIYREPEPQPLPKRKDYKDSAKMRFLDNKDME